MADRGQQPPRTVFDSDDDLTAFLAGMRAKYAKLYPQIEPAPSEPAAAHDGGAAAASSTQPAHSSAATGVGSSGAAADTLLAGTIGSHGDRLNQLRASLQSLQQLLPVRQGVTTNLLSQFTAAAGMDRGSMGGMPGLAASTLPTMLPASMPILNHSSMTTLTSALPTTQPGIFIQAATTTLPAAASDTQEQTYMPQQQLGRLEPACSLGLAAANSRGFAHLLSGQEEQQPEEANTAASQERHPAAAAPTAADQMAGTGAGGGESRSGTGAGADGWQGAADGELAPGDWVFKELAAAYSEQMPSAESSLLSVGAPSSERSEELLALHALLVGQPQPETLSQAAAAAAAVVQGDSEALSVAGASIADAMSGQQQQASQAACMHAWQAGAGHVTAELDGGSGWHALGQQQEQQQQPSPDLGAGIAVLASPSPAGREHQHQHMPMLKSPSPARPVPVEALAPSPARSGIEALNRPWSASMQSAAGMSPANRYDPMRLSTSPSDGQSQSDRSESAVAPPCPVLRSSFHQQRQQSPPTQLAADSPRTLDLWPGATSTAHQHSSGSGLNEDTDALYGSVNVSAEAEQSNEIRLQQQEATLYDFSGLSGPVTREASECVWESHDEADAPELEDLGGGCGPQGSPPCEPAAPVNAARQLADPASLEPGVQSAGKDSGQAAAAYHAALRFETHVRSELESLGAAFDEEGSTVDSGATSMQHQNQHEEQQDFLLPLPPDRPLAATASGATAAPAATGQRQRRKWGQPLAAADSSMEGRGDASPPLTSSHGSGPPGSRVPLFGGLRLLPPPAARAHVSQIPADQHASGVEAFGANSSSSSSHVRGSVPNDHDPVVESNTHDVAQLQVQLGHNQLQHGDALLPQACVSSGSPLARGGSPLGHRTGASAGSSGLIAGPGGVAFSIVLAQPSPPRASPVRRAWQAVLDESLQQQPCPTSVQGIPQTAAAPGSPAAAAPVIAAGPMHDATAVPGAMGDAMGGGAGIGACSPPQLLPLGPLREPPDWEKLNRQLREAGFSGLMLQHLSESGLPIPDATTLHRSLNSVLEQYLRRNKLVQELLEATEAAAKNEQEQEETIRELRRQTNAAKAASERAQRELQDLSSLKLPRTEAQHRQEVTKLRNEAAKLKEGMRELEKQLAGRDEEVKALKAKVASLQVCGEHAADAELVGLRAKVGQLEATLRARDKELEKAKAIKDMSVGAATDGQANALDRAYEAEAAARRLEAEMVAVRSKAAGMEQALRQRERDVATMREDLAAIKQCEAAATAAAQERAATAEEVARKLEAESNTLRAKVRELEATLKAARQDVTDRKQELEALKSAAYEEIYRLEDECRQAGVDLSACRNKVVQLEHVVRAKDREVAKAREGMEAARSAEKERVKIAEEVAVKLESDLTSMKMRVTQLEGAVRTRDRELEKLTELMRQTRSAEYEAYMKQSKTEEGSKRIEADFTQTRLRILQLEAALKARDKDVDKLGRQLDQVKAEAHELASKNTKAEDTGRRLEAELAAARGKALNLEGHLKVKEREQDRLVRLLEQLKGGETEALQRQNALEEALRRQDAELAAARAKAQQVDGQMRARDAAIERLNRQLEATKTHEFENAAQAKETEEAARKLDSETGGLRQRITALEGQLKAKERDAERQARQLDAAQQAAADAALRQGEAEAAARKAEGEAAGMRQRLAQAEGAVRAKEREVERAHKMAELTKAAELEVAVKLAQAEEALSRLDSELAGQRVRVAQLEGAVKAKERELDKAVRSLEQQRNSDHEALAAKLAAEEAAQKLDGDTAQLRQRIVALEGVVKARERDAERQARQLDAAQQAAAEAALRQGEADAAARKAEGDAAGLRQRLAQAEGAMRNKEREMDRLEKLLEQVRGAEVEAGLLQSKAEAAAVQLDTELAAAKARVTQLEAAAKARDKDVERLQRVIDQCKAAEVESSLKAQRAEEASRALELELASLRSQLAQHAGTFRHKDKEVERLGRALEALRSSEYEVTARLLQTEELATRLQGEAAAGRARLVQLEGVLRTKAREVQQLARRLEQQAANGGDAAAVNAAQRAEQATRSKQLEADLGAARSRLSHLEANLAARDKDAQRLRSLLAEAEAAAELQSARFGDFMRKVEADLGQMRTRTAQLTGLIKAKEREVERLGKVLEAERAAEHVAASEVLRLQEELRRSEAGATAQRQQLVQAEGAAKSRAREAERMARLLDAAQAAEAQALALAAQAEEAARKLEADMAIKRQQLVQAENRVQSAQREVARAVRQAEAAAGARAEVAAAAAAATDEARRLDADLARMRQQLVQVQTGLRSRDSEIGKLLRQLDHTKAAEYESLSRSAQSEDALRKLDAELDALRSRVGQVDAQAKSRDGEIVKLQKLLEAGRASELELEARQAAAEEAARRLEGEVAAGRQRATALEGMLRSKERDTEKALKAVEAAKAAHMELEAQLQRSEEQVQRLEGELAKARASAAQADGCGKLRDKELERLRGALEQAKGAQEELVQQRTRAESACKKAEAEAASLRQRCAQAETAMRAKERELERQAKAVEHARSGDADTFAKMAKLEETIRELQSEAAGSRSKAIHLESSVRVKERELERLSRVLETARGAHAETSSAQLAAEDAARRLDGELAGMRTKVSQLEGTIKARDKEVDKLAKQLDAAKAAELDAVNRQQSIDDAARKLDGDAGALRRRIMDLETLLAARERELAHAQRAADKAAASAAGQLADAADATRRLEAEAASARSRSLAAEASAKAKDGEATRLQALLEATRASELEFSSKQLAAEEAARRAVDEVAALRAQLAAVQGGVRSKDGEVGKLAKALDTAKGGQRELESRCLQAEDKCRELETELLACRQRITQCESLAKTKDKEMERLQRLLDQAQAQQHSASLVTGKEAAAIKERAAKAEADAQALRTRVTQLEAEAISRQRQLEELGRMAGYSKAGDTEAAAAALERAARAEEAARRLDQELGALRMRCTQVEHVARSREAEMERLKVVLADKVAKEERRLARDKQAYTRLRSALTAAGAGASGPAGQAKAAGAVAAAARELRPVEIVGLYETQRDTLEQELAGCRAEVRSLSEQLRDAQNLIAIKDRSGAWRTPQELSDMHAKVILLERRAAEQQRELDRVRLDAAEHSRMAERRLAVAESHAGQLKQDNESLVLELESRPGIKEHRALKREIEVLERRLLQLQGSSATNAPGASAEGGEMELGLAAAAKGKAAGSSRALTTAARIARDRDLHRLGLRVLEDFPKDVLVDLLQDVCIETSTSDPTTVVGAVRRAQRLVLDALPRMEAFITDVCEAVYARGAAFVPPHIVGSRDPTKVPEALASWIGLLQEGGQTRSVMRGVVEALQCRPEGLVMPIQGPNDVLSAVRQLVEAEAAALTAQASLAAARGFMEAQPEALLSRLVAHFQRLFDCPSLDGVVATANRLHVTLHEQRNALRQLADTLGLPPDSGASACITRVRGLLEGSGGAAAGGEQLQQDYIKRQQQHAVGASPPAAADSQLAALVQQLMGIFGTRTQQQLLDVCGKVGERLRRLDEVLPRYQKLAGQLMELLAVSSLDQVLPALRARLAQAGGGAGGGRYA